MFNSRTQRLQISCVLVALALVVSTTSCATGEASDSEYFGKVVPPEGQVMRYVSGSEPESLDPQLSTGQPEARLYMALYEGLTEYHPVTMEPIPAIAERWDVNGDSSEFVFHLRKNARFSNGDPITAQDFLYTFQRALSPKLASRSAYLAYYVKYAQAYNEGGMFVRDRQTGKFLLEKDVAPEPAKAEAPATAAVSSADAAPQTQVVAPAKDAAQSSAPAPTKGAEAAPDTPFHRLIHEASRLVVAGDEKDRAKEFKANPKLEAAIKGLELVPVEAEDMGFEAVNDYTFRITLTQSAPFFIGLMPYQLFRVVPRKVIEKHDRSWTEVQNIVTSGPFKLKAWKPYNEVIVVKDPMYWDAATVKLNQINFYPLEEATTMLNLYKAGEVDAIYNHTVPVGWINSLRGKKDYMDAPEVSIEYYMINTSKPPMTDKRVRHAFNMAIDKKAYGDYRKTIKPLTAFSPEGIFPKYPQPKGDAFDPERAKQLLAEAGFKGSDGKFDPKKFPVSDVEITYNTSENNKQTAEFVQSQWKQNLGLTIPINNMEWRTYLAYRAQVQYKGFARAGWVGDYMDPYTFLSLFSTDAGDNGTKWFDLAYAKMLKDANAELDPQKRYELLAKAEAYLLDAQPVIPLGTTATNWVKKPYIKGMYPNPQTLHPWKFIYVEYDQAKWDRGLPDPNSADFKVDIPKPVTAED